MNEINTILNQIMSNKNNYSPENMDLPKAQDLSTAVSDNSKDPPLKGGSSKKMGACGISNMISAHQNSMNSSSRKNSKATHL